MPAGDRQRLHRVGHAVAVGAVAIPRLQREQLADLGLDEGDFPTAEKYYDFALTLPIHPNLSAEQQDYIMERLSHALET